MPQFILDGPHLPPPDLFLFLIPVSLQCLFLHPIFPSTLSRLLRFALMPLSVAMSFATPYKYAIEPRNQAVGMNFVFGIMGAYGIMKSIEWGFATDLLPYTWVGFDGKSPAEEEKAAQVNGNAGGVDNEPREKKMQKRRRTEEAQREYLAGLRRKQAAQDGPIDIIRSTMHLLIAMRGQGYDFGATTTQPFALDHGQFLRRLLLEIAWSHPLLVLCAAILLEPPTSRDAFIYATLPSLNAQHAHMLGGCVTGLAMGTAVFAALTLGYSCCTLITFVVTAIVRLLPLPEALTLPRFDPREYPPLFILSSPPDSVAKFWSVQWHAFFARPFRFLAFNPTQRLFRPLVGKQLGRALGVLATFALSSWIHEFGLATSTSTLPPHSPPLPFLVKWGGSVYFMSQGVGIVLEGMYTALTRRKVGGYGGVLWSSLFVCLCGGMLYKSWMTQGLVREVPPVRYWTWPRFVLPLGCLQPPPLWMNSYPTTYGYERTP
ncbi:hypothetical protein NBRC10512_003152 [Rhodotorula toruloides]|uniref:Wax synthase domain-containing protein n=1 Tax=Rhodotorula toruloides (strain NP11) TaxID=1130832 RepID=M7X0Z6_RHOT1|nr:uncharacterized protein RHTO_06804 [Rhodotorula toruloides NP11]EMS23745.1 hypothetical protein RHTO_06804 [Rhodotorula toruloides NP11]